MRGNPVINFGPCTEPGCTSEQYVRNLCVAHYGRLIRSETSRVPATEFPESALNRFNAWIGDSNEGGCDLWLGALDEDGYGKMTYRSLSYRAHRIAYELRNGPIPDGYTIDHLCRVKDCVNPEHMELVTPSENSRRRQADAEPESWCRSGRHELAGDNVIYSLRDGVNRRRCRACTNERDRRRKKPTKHLPYWSVISIWNLRGQMRAEDLASVYKVSRGTIYGIWQGKTHSEITGKSYHRKDWVHD